MSINMYLASEYEYRRGLANRLLDEGIVDFCLVDHLPWTETPEHDDRIVELDNRVLSDLEYSKVVDMNDIPSVSKELMEQMLPYESMAVKMHMRTTLNSPISEFSEGKRRYLQHLRYWNYMFDKYNINLIVTSCIPHSQGMYVVYGLSRVRKIPMLIYSVNGFFCERCLWGKDINSIGESVRKKYHELVTEGIEPSCEDFDEDIKRYYDKLFNPRNTRSNLESARSFLLSFYDTAFKNDKRYLRREYIKYLGRSLVKEKRIPSVFDKERIWLRERKRVFKAYKYYNKKLVCEKRNYERLIEPVDYSRRYIVFFLQTYPEASTLPMAGVFEEQYNSIQMLARAAEKVGVDVYIRDHPADGYRTKNFYSEISAIKNVHLIGTGEYNSDIIKNSICVATQTGTCIMESLILKKPAIVFGEGHCFKGRPGLFEMRNEVEGEEIIKKILSGVSIDDIDIRRYIYAIQLESVMECDPKETERRVFDDSYVLPAFPIDDRVALIKKYINDVELV